jgi:hypothetical protein
MLARASRLMIAAFALFALSACETKPVAQKLPDISFADKRPISLSVGQLEIVPEYQSPAKRPHVEHLMPISPEAATVRWAQDRIRPMGRTGSARVLIKDARVVEVALKTDKSFTGMFKEEQAERYDAVLDVAIQILDERQFPIADVLARATRSRTVPEGVSLNERDRVMYDLTEALIRDIDSQMEGLIKSYLSRWVAE